LTELVKKLKGGIVLGTHCRELDLNYRDLDHRLCAWRRAKRW